MKKAIAIIVTSFWIDYLVAFLLACLINHEFKARYLLHYHTALLFLLLFLVSALVALWYYRDNYWLFNSKRIMRGNESDKEIDVNLEQSRFQSEEEIERNFKVLDWGSLKENEIVGSPIEAKMERGKLEIAFAKPSHTMVIGYEEDGKLIYVTSNLDGYPSYTGAMLDRGNIKTTKKGKIKFTNLGNVL